MNRVVLILLLSLISTKGQAREACQIKDLAQLANHLLEYKGVKRLSLQVENLKSSADEWQNPEFEVSYLGSSGKIEGTKEIALSLSQPIELGGKREARRKLRQGDSQLLAMEVKENLLLSMRDSLLLLQSLEDKRALLHLYEESIHSFESIVARIAKLPAISPERQVEKETLELAISDYSLKKLALSNLVAEEELHLMRLVGNGCQFADSLPTQFFAADKLLLKDVGKDSFELKKLELKLQKQEALLAFESSNGFPDLKIGPQIEMLREDGKREERFGFNVSFDLPLWNRNSRAYNYERIGLEYIGEQRRLLKEQNQYEIEFLKQKYKLLKSALKSREFGKSLEQKHERAEKLFKKGVISSALIIEVHRQLIELMGSKHETKREALNTLWLGLMQSGNMNYYTEEI